MRGQCGCPFKRQYHRQVDSLIKDINFVNHYKIKFELFCVKLWTPFVFSSWPRSHGTSVHNVGATLHEDAWFQILYPHGSRDKKILGHIQNLGVKVWANLEHTQHDDACIFFQDFKEIWLQNHPCILIWQLYTYGSWEYF